MVVAVGWAELSARAIISGESSTAVASAFNTLSMLVAVVGASGCLASNTSKSLATIASSIGAVSVPIASVGTLKKRAIVSSITGVALACPVDAHSSV